MSRILTCSVGIRDGKAGFPDSAARLEAAITKCGSDPSHSLLDWLMAALRAVWLNPGDLPSFPVRWETYAELQQVFQELGVRNAMYSPENHGPDEEIFTTGMRNTMLQTAPTSLFGLWWPFFPLT